MKAATTHMPERYSTCLGLWIPYFEDYVISSDCDLGSEVQHVVSTTETGYGSCPPKLFNGLKWVVKEKSHCEWVFVMDDDTFINDINFRKIINELDPTRRTTYGRNMTGVHRWKGKRIKFFQGGTGTLIPMFIAREIVEKMAMEGWDWLTDIAHQPMYQDGFWGWHYTGEIPRWHQDDVKLGYFMERNDIEQVDLGEVMRFGPEDDVGPSEPEDILNRVASHRYVYAPDMYRLKEVLDQRGSESSINLKKIQF